MYMYIIYTISFCLYFGYASLVCADGSYICALVSGAMLSSISVCLFVCVSLLNGTRMPLFIEIFVYVCRYMALSTMCIYVSVASLFEVMSMTIWPFVYVGD